MTEPFYAFANLVLDSSLPLPELQRRAGAAPNCRIDLAPAPPAADDAWPCPSPREIRKDDGGHGYTIDFGGTARFEISADGDHVCCRPAAGTSDAALRHLLLDHVLPRVLCLRGLLVLHASTLRAPDGRAVAFLGASGAGKSTLAASLVAAGWRLLADDALVIEASEGRPTAVPTYPGLRLWPDSAAWLASGSEPADQNGNPGRVPKPSRDVARRAELAGSTRDRPRRAPAGQRYGPHRSDASIDTACVRNALVSCLRRRWRRRRRRHGVRRPPPGWRSKHSRAARRATS